VRICSAKYFEFQGERDFVSRAAGRSAIKRFRRNTSDAGPRGHPQPYCRRPRDSNRPVLPGKGRCRASIEPDSGLRRRSNFGSKSNHMESMMPQKVLTRQSVIDTMQAAFDQYITGWGPVQWRAELAD